MPCAAFFSLGIDSIPSKAAFPSISTNTSLQSVSVQRNRTENEAAAV